MGCIPPLVDTLGTGIPQCPDGYHFDPVLNLCCPDNPPPVNMADPTIRKVVSEMSERNFDPAQYYKVAMQGVKDANIIPDWIAALLRMAIRFASPLIIEAASLLDIGLATLSEVFLYAQGEKGDGYYRLAAAMVTDLLAVDMDPDKLVRDFRSGGRQAAMEELGGKIFDVLAAEFAGVVQGATSGAFTVPKGAGIGGLPAVDLSPAQGVAGGKRFLGYASGFAIREGNTDMLAAWLPHGIGEMFKDFAEDFSKNLGIGRMARLVWKPLVTAMVATPMQQALNQQYRPALLDASQACRAFVQGDLDEAGLAAELALHGYTAARQNAIFWQHVKGLDFKDIRELFAIGYLQDADVQMWMGRIGHGAAVSDLMMRAEDARPARSACLKVADHYATEYLLGKITRTQFEGAINSVRHTLTGTTLLTDGEVTTFLSLPEITSAAPKRHLSVPVLFRSYEDGLITLNEFSDAVTALGYSADDVRLLEQELLVAAKRAADRTAKAVASAHRGLFAKLSVAQMKTAYLDGIMTLAQVRQELTDREYAPSAIDAIASEFLVAAKLRPTAPPTA